MDGGYRICSKGESVFDFHCNSPLFHQVRPTNLTCFQSLPNLPSQFPAYCTSQHVETGQILNETSVDESIHLASAFHLAGFRHVIDTLWSVDGKLSEDMAR